MNFAQIRPGSAVFLDASILVYHLTAHALLGSACTALVRQVEQNTLTGFTATHVLSEVAHRLLVPVWCRKAGQDGDQLSDGAGSRLM